MLNINKNQHKIDLLIASAFNSDIIEQIYVTDNGRVYRHLESDINATINLNLTTLYFTYAKLVDDNTDVLYNFDDDADFDQMSIITHTGFFSLPESNLSKPDEHFKYDDYQMEYNNLLKINNISNLLFGNLVNCNKTTKMFHEVNNKIIEYYEHRTVINNVHDNDEINDCYIFLKYSNIENIWNDHILKKSIKENVQQLTNIDLEIKDITPENISDIGTQVQAILY